MLKAEKFNTGAACTVLSVTPQQKGFGEEWDVVWDVLHIPAHISTQIPWTRTLHLEL